MFIWYLNDSLVAKRFYKSLVDGVQADSIYCRKKINMMFAGLGSVRIVKNCDLGPELLQFSLYGSPSRQITYIYYMALWALA